MQILAIQATLRDASVTGISHAAESLLTQGIDADDYQSYANRSVIRARHAEWENALQDAAKVRYYAYHEATEDRLTRLYLTVDCDPALLIRFYFQGHRPLRKRADLGRDGSFRPRFHILQS
jgi:hypothetical protein